MKKIFASTTLLIAAYGYFHFSDNSPKMVKNFLDYKNPYTRKPASVTDAFENIKETKVAKEEVVVKTDKGYMTKIESLKRLVTCYESNCDFADGDPREYDLSVGRELKKEMMDLYEDVLKKEIVDKSIEKTAIEFLAISDGHVKEAALLLLSTQPPSQDALDAIINDVLDYHDPNLIGLTLMELEKYKDEAYKVQIRESFLKNFKSGSLLVREALAKGLYRFVSEDTRSQFENIMESLPKNSKVRNNIKYSLERFDSKTRL